MYAIPKGVKVAVTLGGRRLKVTGCGRIHNASRKRPFRLHDVPMLEISTKRSDVFVLGVDDRLADCESNDRGRVWTHPVNLRLSGRSGEPNRVLYTLHPNNCVRLLAIGETSFDVFEVSLVAQGDHIYVAAQLLYSADMRKLTAEGGAYLSCPQFEGTRDDLVELVAYLLGEHVLNRIATLPELAPEDRLASRTPTLAWLHSDEAWVEWFNISRRFGAVRLPDGEVAFIHGTECPEREGGLRYLSPGEFIRFEKRAALGGHAPETNNTGAKRFSCCVKGARLLYRGTSPSKEVVKVC